MLLALGNKFLYSKEGSLIKITTLFLVNKTKSKKRGVKMKKKPATLFKKLLKIFKPHILVKTMRSLREHQIQILVIQRLGFNIGSRDNGVKEDEIREMERYDLLYAPAFRMAMHQSSLIALLIKNPNQFAQEIADRLSQ